MPPMIYIRDFYHPLPYFLRDKYVFYPFIIKMDHPALLAPDGLLSSHLLASRKISRAIPVILKHTFNEK